MATNRSAHNPGLLSFTASRWLRVGVPAGVASAVAVGVPTDVIDNPWFSRMTPVLWWEYPVLVATAVLTGLWFALPSTPRSGRGGRVTGATVLSTLAVGCPICNKIVVALLGVSGALAIWAPLQPVLGAVSVFVILLAVITKRRLSRLPCPVPTSAPGSTSLGSAAEHDSDIGAAAVPHVG